MGNADERHEREIGKLIDERDRCEEIIDCLCDAVLGQGRPEWSSAYGYDDALLEVQDAMFATPAQTVDVEAVREVIAELCAYSPIADAYSGKHIHPHWADKLSQAIGDKP